MESSPEKTKLPNIAANPWGKVQQCSAPRSLTSVMDEEYALQLQNEEPLSSDSDLDVALKSAEYSALGVDSTQNDLLLAQMLQLEYDRENDAYILAQEKQVNGPSKVTMSFKNFCLTHPYNNDSDALSSDVRDQWVSSDEEDLCRDGESAEFNEATRTVTSKRRGGPGAEIVTKHDPLVCGRKNAENVEKFPPHFRAGDVTNISFSNKVFNQLKQHSMKEEKAGMKVHEKKEHSTHEHAFDEGTRLILYKLVNSGMLDSLSGIISTGKEAVVVHARGGKTTDGNQLPAECAIKVFKTTLNEFKTRERYISEDYRFRDRFARQNPRKIIKLWAEKEFRNLKRMWDAHLACPQPVFLRKQILIMSFIGADQQAAPKLKDANLSKSQYKQAFEEIKQAMRRMYVDCKLIHADMSEYNVLWHEDKCWIIDVSQSVEPEHPHALHFLYRDCRNVVDFFTRSAGLKDIMVAGELFAFVCGKELDGEQVDALEHETQDFENDEEMLATGLDSKPYEFEYHFNRSIREQAEELSDTSEEPG